MRPLPKPERSKQSIARMREFFNTDPDTRNFELILAYIVGALRPKGPYPLLVFNSEQGSGKTTTSRCVRMVIDPNESPVRSQPRDERDLMIAASNSHMLAFDNLSHIPDWLSDGLCRLSTGGGFATRELHTDEDEILFNVQRPALLNGIEEICTRGDLMDRAIIVELPRIPADKRKTETEFWAAFEQCHAGMFGYVLDGVASGLKNLATTKLKSLPRMADFANWITACEEGLGIESGVLLDAYNSNRTEGNEVTLDASPIARYIMSVDRPWKGTAADLLRQLDNRATESERRLRSWPQSARGVSNSLRRLIPSLASVGISVNFDRASGGNRERTITMTTQKAA